MFAANKHFRTVASLAVAGTLFAGYLSGVKLITDTCALNEPCPYVLGYPACWYGFFMFLALAVVSALGMTSRMGTASALRVTAWISAAGTLFAGWLTVGEAVTWSGGYTLGLPSCAYGLVFYVAVLALTLKALRAQPDGHMSDSAAGNAGGGKS